MFERSEKLFEEAHKFMPGGVNSPARAYSKVGGPPPFIKRAKGPHIVDEDDNEYIDTVLSWGPAILGHADPDVVEAAKAAVERGSSFGAPTRRETEMAREMTDRVPGLDVLRLVSSGTEACMSAVRVARGATGRDKIIKFDGCYHGHADEFLIAAGSGALTLGTPDSPGVTEGTAKDTLVADFNDIDSVAELAEAYGDDIATVILEPVCGNTGCIPPKDGFLQDLRELCDEHGILLTMDEVMTGFRLARGGAAERFGVTPDLYCFGKVVGGGFPLAGYGGKEEIMRHVAPDGPVYQAGTLSGNPVAVAAGLKTLQKLDDDAYETLESIGRRLEDGLQAIIDDNGYPLFQQRVGSMFSLFFREEPVDDHQDATECDLDKFTDFFGHMLRSGVYMAPSQFEAGFLSTLHGGGVVDELLNKTEDALAKTFG